MVSGVHRDLEFHGVAIADVPDMQDFGLPVAGLLEVVLDLLADIFFKPDGEFLACLDFGRGDGRDFRIVDTGPA